MNLVFSFKAFNSWVLVKEISGNRAKEAEPSNRAFPEGPDLGSDCTSLVIFYIRDFILSLQNSFLNKFSSNLFLIVIKIIMNVSCQSDRAVFHYNT